VTDRFDQQVIDWLLEGDPAIRWQVLRDLDGPEGAPSRWVTLRALRVLRWAGG
jgi:hypothetical protein